MADIAKMKKVMMENPQLSDAVIGERFGLSASAVRNTRIGISNRRVGLTIEPKGPIKYTTKAMASDVRKGM